MTSKLCFKCLAFIALWVASLIIISSELKDYFWEDKPSYETALRSFHKVRLEDRLKAWNLISKKFSLSYEDKLLAVRNGDLPPGNFGLPVVLKGDMPGTLEMLVRQGWRDHCYNQFVSDLIPVVRSLPDVRDQRSMCPKVKSDIYDQIEKLLLILPKGIGYLLPGFRSDFCLTDEHRCNRNISYLPKASVVIIFHNEAWSTLLRTVHSVINTSPAHLLDEIILVDDYSNMPHLKDRLGVYTLALPRVTLIRTTRREGLIRARILGTKHANSPVVIFLDSHCECTKGWMEPLLQRIADDPTTVVSPVIDHIDASTFEYKAQDTKNIAIGGFNWQLKYIWRHIHNNDTVLPIKTPTIAGGLFAISKAFFTRIGYYDESFDIWGGENLELSFKTWMCGGSLEIVPCSHVGHVFRKSFPYSIKEFLEKNLIRLAEVWMDDYAKYFYQRIGNKKVNFGDVSKQKELRSKLQCKSFEWYLNNVYPQLEVPDNVIAYGRIHNMHGICLDSSVSPVEPVSTVHPKPCHGQGGNQFWQYTLKSQIKRDEYCLDYLFGLLLVLACRDRSDTQKWIFEEKTKHLRHVSSQGCLKNARFNDSHRIIVERCFDEKFQVWLIDAY